MSNILPKEINNFIEEFSKLPSVGPRMATRLAFHLVSVDGSRFKRLSDSLVSLDKVNRCPRCFFVKEKNASRCFICSDPKRNKKIIAIVEEEADLISMEKSGEFNGIYLVMGGMSGRGSLTETQKKRLRHLKHFIKKYLGGEAYEIIIAVDLNSQGDYVSGLIKKGFAGSAKKITRLGRGLPTGSEVEFADEETLAQALKGRR